jgi:SAM (Sterile alpha motif) domain-containing protein
MDVGVWLQSLSLGQYEATFRDNEIDGAVLPRLTVDDLKDLGVAVVGHRRKIMSACSALVRGQFRWSRTPSDRGHVLRSCRFDEPRREARRGSA